MIDSATENVVTQLPRETITDAEFKKFCQALKDGHSRKSAALYVGRSEDGLRLYSLRTQKRTARVKQARGEWWNFHLLRLKNDKDDGSGASSRVRASLGALASVDERYRKEIHVGGTHNTLILADPRPPSFLGSGEIGDPARYALPRGESQRGPEVVVDGEAEAETVDSEEGQESVEGGTQE